MENVFIPHASAQCVDRSKPIILLWDGHGSHETPELRQIVYNAELTFILLCFPSKCTHKIQPLDVVVFAQSQRQWRDHCDTSLLKGIVMNRYNVIQNYLKVRSKYMSAALMKSAFKKTGLYPVNRTVFTEEDFAPSKASSTTAWTPDSFPDDVPTSDIEIPSDAESEDEWIDEDDVIPAAVQPSQSILTLELDDDDELSDDDPDFTLSDDEDDHDGNESVSPCTENVEPPTSSPYQTHLAASGRFLPPDELISQSQRDMAAMQDILDGEKTRGQLIEEVHNLRKIINALTDCLQESHAQTLASNAHATIIKRRLQDKCIELNNTKKQQQRANGSSKIKARFLTLPEFQDEFNAEEASRLERERQASDKEAQKTAERLEREAKIRRDAVSKGFDLPLTWYKLKDDLLTLALALQLPTTGLNAQDLRASILVHLNENMDTLRANPRFSGLYATQKRRRAANAAAPNGTLPVEQVRFQPPPPPAFVPTHPASNATATFQNLHYTDPNHNQIGNAHYYQHYNPFGEGSSQNPSHPNVQFNFAHHRPPYPFYQPYNHWHGPN